jgi:serine/threonine-protein kinase SRPK3
MPFYESLRVALLSRHQGAGNIRKLLTSFEIPGPHGTHSVLVHEVSQMSLRNMDKIFMNDCGFDEVFVKAAVRELLQAVDFLHSEVHAVHTGELKIFYRYLLW